MSVFIDYVRTRLLKLNKNYIAFVTGPTGSGKSLASLRIGELADHEFNINHVVFSSQEFLKLLNKPGELKPGNIVVYDEAGVGMSNREWHQKENIAMGKVGQTFRHRNIGLIMTVPTTDFVDIQLRILAHSLFITDYIDYPNKTCFLKHYKIQYNPRTGDTYKKKPKFRSNGEIVIIPKIGLRLPKKKLLNAYLKKKDGFTSQLNEETEEVYETKGLGKAFVKRKKKMLENEMIADSVLKKHRNLLHTYHGKETIRLNDLIRIFQLPHKRSEAIKRLVEVKIKDEHREGKS